MTRCSSISDAGASHGNAGSVMQQESTGVRLDSQELMSFLGTSWMRGSAGTAQSILNGSLALASSFSSQQTGERS